VSQGLNTQSTLKKVDFIASLVAKPAVTKFIPLPAGKTLKLGRGTDLDVPVDHASVSKNAGRIVLGKWQDKIDKHGSIVRELFKELFLPIIWLFTMSFDVLLDSCSYRVL
jgi:hypothetical protein